MTVSEQLKTLGKQVRRDIKRYVRQGSLPAQRYVVQTSDTYGRRLEVLVYQELSDPDRSILRDICRSHIDPAFPVSMWVAGDPVA
jgi:hypothetical protein